MKKSTFWLMGFIVWVIVCCIEIYTRIGIETVANYTWWDVFDSFTDNILAFVLGLLYMKERSQ